MAAARLYVDHMNPLNGTRSPHSTPGDEMLSPSRIVQRRLEDVDTMVLEGKLKLLEVQRELIAVRCQRFVELIDTMNNTDPIHTIHTTNRGSHFEAADGGRLRLHDASADLLTSRPSTLTRRGSLDLSHARDAASSSWKEDLGFYQELHSLTRTRSGYASPSSPSPRSRLSRQSPRGAAGKGKSMLRQSSLMAELVTRTTL